MINIQETRKTKSIKSAFAPTEIGAKIIVDEPNKKWGYLCSGFKKLDSQKKEVFRYSNIYGFNEIESFEILQNNSAISFDGMGNAFVIEILSGSNKTNAESRIESISTKNHINSMKLKINISRMSNPLLLIEYVNIPTLLNSSEYEMIVHNIQKDVTILEILISYSESESSFPDLNTSYLERMTKIKRMYDLGFISKKEFSSKREEILDEF